MTSSQVPEPEPTTSVEPEVLIFGDGVCARRVASHLIEYGIAVSLVTAGKGDKIHGLKADMDRLPDVLTDATLQSCQGYANDFRVVLSQKGKRITKKVASIAVIEDEQRTANYEAYDLADSERVITISDMEARLGQNDRSDFLQRDAKVVFLNGWSVDSHPAMSGRMLKLCRQVQTSDAGRTFFMTGNLKVAQEGFESCYQKAKAEGTVFLKFTQRFPTVDVLDDGRVQIDYWDELARMPFQMTADWVVVDETIGPAPVLSNLAAGLRIDTDSAGWLQSDNVHRLSNHTNRTGIFVAGATRAVMSADDQLVDADQVAMHITTFIDSLSSGSELSDLPKVEIDPGLCARCMTCYRLCPHAAIHVSEKVEVVSEACQSCGICAAGCPARAIRVDGLNIQEDLKKIGRGAGAYVPRIVAFCCKKSAIQARELALTMGHILPDFTIIEGLCGGSFSTRHLLASIETGADGVMMLTCHPGNCHSEQGNLRASQRFESAMQVLAHAGIESERLYYGTLAANMGGEFAMQTLSFEAKIKALGPLTKQK